MYIVYHSVSLDKTIMRVTKFVAVDGVHTCNCRYMQEVNLRAILL